MSLCSKSFWSRFLEQWEGRAGYKSNCQALMAGGRAGLEMLTLEGSSLAKDFYRLAWESEKDQGGNGRIRLLFFMSSPLTGRDKNKEPEHPVRVIGRWRAMLESARFF